MIQLKSQKRNPTGSFRNPLSISRESFAKIHSQPGVLYFAPNEGGQISMELPVFTQLADQCGVDVSEYPSARKD